MIIGIFLSITHHFNIYFLPLGIFGTLGIVILLIHLVYSILQFFKKEPMVVIGIAGLLINYYGIYSIRWSELKSVDLFTVQGKGHYFGDQFLRITLNQPNSFLLKLNIIQRIFMKTKLFLGYTYHLEININSLDNFAEDVLEMIQNRLHDKDGKRGNTKDNDLRTPEWLKQLDERWGPL
jgi:hypothetical protein